MDHPDFPWWRDGVIYQIYPRSFSDSNGDGLGDLPGIISRLDYLEDLGVDAIWLSPIYPSPDVDFGYDVADYSAIDPRFGTMDDFDCLVSAAKKRHIHIILDLVLNHTSDQHPWFKAARSSRDNPYHEWYLWKDPRRGGKPPNNWKAVIGGSGWEFVPEISQYYYHSYFSRQPDLNWRNPATRQALLDVFRFWLEKGVDGFRLDVFNIYFKNADFPDNPRKMGLRDYDRQDHLHDRDQPEMLFLLAEIRAILDSYPETYVVGEPLASDAYLTAYYCGQDFLHQAFNFEFLASPFNPPHYLMPSNAGNMRFHQTPGRATSSTTTTNLVRRTVFMTGTTTPAQRWLQPCCLLSEGHHSFIMGRKSGCATSLFQRSKSLIHWEEGTGRSTKGATDHVLRCSGMIRSTLVSLPESRGCQSIPDFRSATSWRKLPTRPLF